jgi:3-dehydroquinate dehydratase / shikimate dehydrogenase
MSKICVPVCARDLEGVHDALERAALIADIIEVRLDCLSEKDLPCVMKSLEAIRTSVSCPIIMTLRPTEQGGYRAIDEEERLKFWSERRVSDFDFADVEEDLLTSSCELTQLLESQPGKNSIICSHHDFDRVPPDLDQIYQRMSATPARILKIAVQADDAIDCLPVFRVLERAQSESRDMIAIAMGQAGVATRILGPSRGSFLTYGSLDDEGATAPGQLKARELREVYRIDRIDRQTEIMGLIGSPMAHSVSPNIHNAAFAAAGLNAVYIPFEVHDVYAFMRRMVHPRSREIDWKMRGLSVTAPHKTAVMQHLDWTDPAAREIGAVNTIVIEGDDLHGYNTDANGFIAPVRQRLGSLKNARCAIIGAGGAARSVLWALQREGAVTSLFARNVEKAKVLAAEAKTECLPLTDKTFDGFDVVVNATSVGTRGPSENHTVATANQLHGVRLVYDLVYNPVETKLMREARAAGSAVIGGLEMLLAQAAMQFNLWTGLDADHDTMKTAAETALSNSAS